MNNSVFVFISSEFLEKKKDVMVTKLLTLKSRAYLKAEILTRSSPLFQENEKTDMVATLEVIYQQKLEVMYLRSVTFIPPPSPLPF